MLSVGIKKLGENGSVRSAAAAEVQSLVGGEAAQSADKQAGLRRMRRLWPVAAEG